MKFTVMTALIGAASSVPIKNLMESTAAKCDRMSGVCNTKELSEIDASNLIQLGDEPAATTEHVDHGVNNYKDNTAEEDWKHYGKTRNQMIAENKAILDTQKSCMDFVAAHQDHPQVCNWCHESYVPKDPFQWNPDEGVWYKWSGNQYHYWGPSKEGLKHKWSWYDGYWHHDGYVFKYEGDKWHRFQGGDWAVYNDKIDIDPIPPYTQECRMFNVLAQIHIPDSLTEHDVARCQVSEGAHKAVYEWTDEKDCTFLGGAKVFQKNFVCKDGSSEQWEEKEVCVQGPKMSHEGLDYKTGKAKVVEKVEKKVETTPAKEE